ncbi:S8 family serine peptidase [Aeromicrobium sp. NPDC092404]|uniref:S8 family serine peptidase n=1 Tax=Aeromicrobium sp. NPDC092404 TaxID=3154976 RepID=UPI003415470E
MSLRACAVALAVGLVPITPVVLAAPAPAAESDQPCESGVTRYIDDPSAARNLDQLGFPEAWKIATGKGVRVAVIDSGVNAGNAHFAGALEKGRSFVGGSAQDDDFGHGTAVAGIIAARRHEGSVLVGAAPDATIVPVRTYEDTPDTALLAKGIRWAAEQDVDVINVSVSTGPNDTALPELRSAVKYAVSTGAIIVASGGNQGELAPLTQKRFPAALPGVIGVAATRSNGTVDDWSIHGPHNDVAAPGEEVLIAFLGNGDCLGGANGRAYTSWATAYVSGLAAALREEFPDATAKEITNRILDTATRPVRSRRDNLQGWGVIQPYAALTKSVSSEPGTTDTDDAQSARGGIEPLSLESDPMQPSRTAMLWWAIGSLGVAGVALVLRPWIRKLRKS